MYSIQYTVYSIQYTVYSIKYTVYSLQCTNFYHILVFCHNYIISLLFNSCQLINNENNLKNVPERMDNPGLSLFQNGVSLQLDAVTQQVENIINIFVWKNV